jgi:hypothetical protein
MHSFSPQALLPSYLLRALLPENAVNCLLNSPFYCPTTASTTRLYFTGVSETCARHFLAVVSLDSTHLRCALDSSGF